MNPYLNIARQAIENYMMANVILLNINQIRIQKIIELILKKRLY